MSASRQHDGQTSIPAREAITGLAVLGLLAVGLAGSVIYRMTDSRWNANRSLPPPPPLTVYAYPAAKEPAESTSSLDLEARSVAKLTPQVTIEELFQRPRLSHDGQVQPAAHEAPLAEPNR